MSDLGTLLYIIMHVSQEKIVYIYWFEKGTWVKNCVDFKNNYGKGSDSGPFNNSETKSNQFKLQVLNHISKPKRLKICMNTEQLANINCFLRASWEERRSRHSAGSYIYLDLRMKKIKGSKL